MTFSAPNPVPANPGTPDKEELATSLSRILARGICPVCSGGLVKVDGPVIDGHRHIHAECILGHRWTVPHLDGGVFLVGTLPERMLREECVRCGLPVAVDGEETHQRGDVEITTVLRSCFGGHHFHTPRDVGHRI